MKAEVKIITCPKCGSKQEFTVYPTLNASSNPGLKEKFLDGDLTTLACESCGFSGSVEYPMLYHDLEKMFSVYFFPGSNDRKANPGSVLPAHLVPEIEMRLVHTPDELREKIFIFRDNLDDRIVEVVKDNILREMEARKEENMPDVLYYAQDIFKCEGRSLIFVPKKDDEYLEPIKIPFETYEKIKMLTHGIWERPIDGYTSVDREWVSAAEPKEKA